MILGLLLPRAGVDALVLEKHADFLRDFRLRSVSCAASRSFAATRPG
jgi:2-polyprenyl-6-methoxyphenol hydroxylase-like FAD-dependent oxidoreductase